MASRVAPMPQQKQKPAGGHPFKARSSETDSSLLRNGDQPQHQQQDYSPASVATSLTESQKGPPQPQRDGASQPPATAAPPPPPPPPPPVVNATVSSDRGDYSNLVKHRYFGGGGGTAGGNDARSPYGSARLSAAAFADRSKSTSSDMSLSEIFDTVEEGPPPTGGMAGYAPSGSAGLLRDRRRDMGGDGDDDDGDSWLVQEDDGVGMGDDQAFGNTRRNSTPPLTLYSTVAPKPGGGGNPYITESAGVMSPLSTWMDVSSGRNTPNSQAVSDGGGTPVVDRLLASSLTSSQSGSVLQGSIGSSMNSSMKQPMLYSAIGSLENCNVNSLTTLHNRYLAPSKEFCRIGGVGTQQSHLMPPANQGTGQAKQKSLLAAVSSTNMLAPQQPRSFANSSNQGSIKAAVRSGRNSSTKATKEASSRDPSSLSSSQKVNGEQVFGVLKKNATDQQEGSSSGSPNAQLQKRGSNTRKVTTTSAIKTDKMDNRKTKANAKGTKKVSYGPNGQAKQKPVEMFRPSSDAYTPRIERKRIKYKAAEARTPVQHMASPMGTLQRPNFRDALRRVAMILHQHVVKIEGRFEGQSDTKLATDDGLFKASMRDIFHEDTYRTPTYKCNMVRIPMARPGMVYGLRKIRVMYEIPSETEIYDFGHQLFKSVQLSSECSIVCLIYVERLMEIAKVPLLASTWRPIFMCGLLLASKVWQDLSSWNIEFTGVYPQFSLEAINRLELNFLRNVKWDLYISSRYVTVPFWTKAIVCEDSNAILPHMFLVELQFVRQILLCTPVPRREGRFPPTV